MGLFGFGTKKRGNDLSICAPADGDIVDLIKVTDPIFSQRTLGDGFAVEPTDGVIFAPVTGVVTLIATTQHAVGMRMDNGLEVLVHFGLDTYKLNGEPFRIHVKHGQLVKGGHRLVTANLGKIKAAGLDDTIVVTFSNSVELSARPEIQYGPCLGGRRIGRVVLN